VAAPAARAHGPAGGVSPYNCGMNPRLELLQPYPFEKLRKLLSGATPPANLKPIVLSIGEPQHPTPALLKDAITANLGSLSRYPQMRGLPELRVALAQWIARRHRLDPLDPERDVIPAAGTKEALFGIAQAVVDPTDCDALVVSPNPFYQIYEGAALLAGAKPYFINALAENGFRPDWAAVPESVWKRTRLVYACSPGNPTGRVMTLAEWKVLFDLSDRHGFIVVSDECYSEIYFDEASPPLGGLAAAKALGRTGYPRLLAMGSLSKRSNAPGLRSGFIAGDAAILDRFGLYRTYYGTGVSNTVQLASIAAWNDEAHVRENRRMYREKFAAFRQIVNPVLPLTMPEAAFYYWAAIPGDDAEFARALYAATHVTVLPGSYIGREAHGVNPGQGFVRIALVSTVEEATEAAKRVRDFAALHAGMPTTRMAS
jgi:N-succinyldiaminopimelate aminotransferase